MFVSNGTAILKTPISLSSSSFPSLPSMATGGWPAAYSGIYGKQLWVYVVVSKRARATARLPLLVYLRDDKNRPRVDEHPMSQVLSNPNPGMSGFDMWLWVSSTFDIYGETFLYKRRIPGPVGLELYPLHPTSMSWDEKTAAWTFDNGAQRINRIPDADLIHFKGFNPDSLTHGMSPLEPLRATLENEWAARTATSSFWSRGARPGMFLTHKGQLSEPAQARLKRQVDSVMSGPHNTGTTVVLEEGMEPKPMTLTSEEAQYIETRKLNREEVCAAYDIPPPVVHILDHATFSNITEQMRSMYRDTMAPHLKGFEATIDRDLRRAEFPGDEIYAEFLMDEVLRGDFETRQTALAQAVHMTLAEKRRVDNLPYIDGTDRIFLNTATLPLDAIDSQYGSGPAPATDVPAQSEDGADVIPLAVARSVMGRLSWQKSLNDINAAALTQDAGIHAGPVLQALALERASDGDVSSLRKRIRALVKE